MFMIRCTSCGREQEWTEEVVLGQTEIEGADRSIFCSCGCAVVEENGVLCEIRSELGNLE